MDRKLSSASASIGPSRNRIRTACRVSPALLALFVLNGCQQKLTVAQPTVPEIMHYHVRDIVLERSQYGSGSNRAVVAESDINSALQSVLQGNNPADVAVQIVHFKEPNTSSWTDKKGMYTSHTWLNPQLKIKIGIRDARTRRLLAERWFSFRHRASSVEVRKSLTERLRVWAGF